MVAVVQLVRASDCGSECRGFESHLPPNEKEVLIKGASFFRVYIPPMARPIYYNHYIWRDTYSRRYGLRTVPLK